MGPSVPHSWIHVVSLWASDGCSPALGTRGLHYGLWPPQAVSNVTGDPTDGKESEELISQSVIWTRVRALWEGS